MAIADIDQKALDRAGTEFNEGVVSEAKSRVSLTRVDVGNRREVDDWIEATVQRFGKLDGAANCAGVIGKHHGTKGVDELEDDQWDLIMRVNLTGMMYCLRAELQKMGPGGSVVCVTSIQASLGFAKHAAYVASKVCVGLTSDINSQADVVRARFAWFNSQCRSGDGSSKDSR